MHKFFQWILSFEILVLEGYDRGGKNPPLFFPYLIGFNSTKILLETIKYLSESRIRKSLPFRYIKNLAKIESKVGGPYKIFTGDFNFVANSLVYITLKNYSIDNKILYKWIKSEIKKFFRDSSSSSLFLLQALLFLSYNDEIYDFKKLLRSIGINMSHVSNIYILFELHDFSISKIFPSLRFIDTYLTFRAKSDEIVHFENVLTLMYKVFPELKLSSNIFENSFMLEVIMAPHYLYKYKYISGINTDTITQISFLGAVSWILFSHLDDENDGHKTFLISNSIIAKLQSYFGSELHKKGFDSSAISLFEMNKASNITEDLVIKRSSLYYLVYEWYGGIFANKIIESLQSYILAKQYMDDIVDYTEDISNGRHTLLTDKYPTAEELTINLRLLLLRIRKLIRKAKRCMPEYPPVVDLADRIEEFFKI